MRNLIGVTQHAAEVGDDLNLCVEGAYDLMVDLADGVEAVEAGDTVHMADDGSWRLVAGLEDATGYVAFGITTERMTRRRITQVKLSAAQAGAAGGGAASSPVLLTSGFDFGPAYDGTTNRVYTDSAIGFRPKYAVRGDAGISWPSPRYPGDPDTPDYITFPEGGVFDLEMELCLANNYSPVALMISANIYDDAGALQNSSCNLTVSEDYDFGTRLSTEASYKRIAQDSHYTNALRLRRRLFVPVGWKISFVAKLWGQQGYESIGFDPVPSDPASGDPAAFHMAGNSSLMIRKVA